MFNITIKFRSDDKCLLNKECQIAFLEPQRKLTEIKEISQT